MTHCMCYYLELNSMPRQLQIMHNAMSRQITILKTTLQLFRSCREQRIEIFLKTIFINHGIKVQLLVYM